MVTCPDEYRRGDAPEWAYDEAWQQWLDADEATHDQFHELDLRQLPDNFFYYAQLMLQVEDKQTQHLVPFRFKPVQLRLAIEIVAQWIAKLPVRIIVLKARREGVSTVVQAFMFWVCALRERRKAFTIAQDDETVAYLHGMTETYYNNLPPFVRPLQGANQRGKVLEFANPIKDPEKRMQKPGLQSWLKTVSLTNAGAGQGATKLHLSEIGLWDPGKAGKSLNTVLKVVPYAPETLVVQESTARGIGTLFHQLWTRAEMRVSDYTAIFIGWNEEPTNRVAAPHDFVRTEEEEELAELHELDDDQLLWRRLTIENECYGDLDNFHQEYPLTPEEAFLASGRPYFPARAVQARMKWAEGQQPALTGHLEEKPEVDGDDNGGRGWTIFTPVRRAYTLRIWTPPEEHEDYLIFGDASGGKPDADMIESTGRRVPSRGDWHAAYVFKRSRLEIVAAWHGKVDRDEYGDHLYRLGKLYSGCTKSYGQKRAGALVAVEITGGWGQVPISRLKYRGYPRIYRRPVREDVHFRDESESLGWDTSIGTRPLMLDSLKQAIRTEPDNGGLICPDRFLYAECSTFVYAENGKPGAMPGCFDDRVMAAAGGCWLWETTPRRRSGAKPKAYKPRSAVTGV